MVCSGLEYASDPFEPSVYDESQYLKPSWLNKYLWIENNLEFPAKITNKRWPLSICKGQ